MAQTEKLSIQAIEELGRLWDIGIRSGLASDGEQAFGRLRTVLAAKLSDRAQL